MMNLNFVLIFLQTLFLEQIFFFWKNWRLLVDQLEKISEQVILGEKDKMVPYVLGS